MKKTGRPSKYINKYNKIASDLMASGLSKTAVAGAIGISRNTLYQWCKRYNDFRYTIKTGELRSLNFWERIGILSVEGKINNFNASIWIFTMKTRFHRVYKDEFSQILT